MADCEKLGKCPFFANSMANMPATADMLKQRYCHGDKTRCARYQVSSKGLAVPTDLFPNQLERAHQMISAQNVSS